MVKERNIFAVLEKDHREVTDLLEKISKRAAEGKRIDTMVDKVHRELESHSLAEEEILYPKLANHRHTQDEADQAMEEHEKIRLYLQKLEGVSSVNGEFRQAFEDLRHEVENHVEEEEGEIFPKMRTIFSELELVTLAEEFELAKASHWAKSKAA